MERLTQRIKTGEVLMASAHEEKYTTEEWICMLQDRVADYEDSGVTPEEYMRICFAMLDVADEMWYLADAADSPGAFLEVQYCRYVKKRVRRLSEAVKEGKCETHTCN